MMSRQLTSRGKISNDSQDISQLKRAWYENMTTKLIFKRTKLEGALKYCKYKFL